jgi:hypothetical protein
VFKGARRHIALATNCSVQSSAASSIAFERLCLARLVGYSTLVTPKAEVQQAAHT